jgi:hypothetical protein
MPRVTPDLHVLALADDTAVAADRASGRATAVATTASETTAVTPTIEAMRFNI